MPAQGVVGEEHRRGDGTPAGMLRRAPRPKGPTCSSTAARRSQQGRRTAEQHGEESRLMAPNTTGCERM